MRIKQLQSRALIKLFVLFFILNSSFLTYNCKAQTAGKYDFYRYLQQYAVEIDPLGEILGRVSGQFEQRLDPNFSRVYEVVYQKNVADKNATGWYPESAFTVGALERIFLTDNAALLGQYVGIGAGAGIVGKNIGVRITAEIGYKIAFGGGAGHFFIEPKAFVRFLHYHKQHWAAYSSLLCFAVWVFLVVEVHCSGQFIPYI